MNKKNRFNILLDKLKKIRFNRNTLIFGLFLAISALLWLLNALNKEYSHVIQYPVKFTNVPANIGLDEGIPSKIGVEIYGHGYDILSYKIDHAKTPIIVNMEKTIPKKYSDDHYYILAKNMLPYAKKLIKGNVEAVNIHPDTLHLYVTKTICKNLPVQSKISYSVAQQYMISSGPHFSPDTVKVKGPTHIIRKLQHIQTAAIDYGKLNANTNRYVPLQAPENVELEPQRVKLEITVDKFTEISFNLPVEVVNIPQNIELELIPSDIQISFQVPISRYEELSTSTFRLRADYDKAKHNKLYPELILKPDYVQHIRLHRDHVDFIENKTGD
ncbi:MAG: YbbR-like domain-containing protein [Bacteroidota bacterium]|nr:YbbR-like domain-containing protein [Bacteroidota bacterium]